MSLDSNGPKTEVPAKVGRARLLGWTLLGVSALLYSLILTVPFLPLSGGQKIWTAGALAVTGEGAFWIAVVLLGREVVRRYRSLFNPRNWFGGRR